MTIKIVPLGAGQDIGRSCIIVTLGNKNIMCDCGFHNLFNDMRKFPDFSFISKNKQFTKVIDCVLISHFHMDHCGALPYFTERLGYDGPIFMTYPTKAVLPTQLEDAIKFSKEDLGMKDLQYSRDDIKNCMKKVTVLNLMQTVRLDNELEIRAYYAGHVLGAAMFYVKDLVSGKSMVYTGDYNMTPDRHLGPASIERLRPDVFITETTYATTIRDNKSSRERDFLKAVHQAVERGGKVLIPVFALGRAQELCILLDMYWQRMNLKVPIYFSTGVLQKINKYYQLFINWSNQKLKSTFVKNNVFDFSRIGEFNKSMADMDGPMVVLATPGMVNGGMSLEIFKKWAPNEKNLIVVPGYCSEGTVGNKILTTKTGKVEIPASRGQPTQYIDLKCEVRQISFSAHADAKGILHLISMCQPKSIVLVHGEKGKMNYFKQKVEKDLRIPCYDPANGTTIEIKDLPWPVEVDISLDLLKQTIPAHQQDILQHEFSLDTGLEEEDMLDDGGLEEQLDAMDEDEEASASAAPASASSATAAGSSSRQQQSRQEALARFKRARIDGILIVDETQKTPRLLAPDAAAAELGLRQHSLKFSSIRPLPRSTNPSTTSSNHGQIMGVISSSISRYIQGEKPESSADGKSILVRTIAIQYLSDQADGTDKLSVSWSFEDDTMAENILSIVDEIINQKLLNLGGSGSGAASHATVT